MNAWPKSLKNLWKSVLLAGLLAWPALASPPRVRAAAAGDIQSRETLQQTKDVIQASRATRGGRYSQLLAKIRCAEDRLDLGKYYIVGYEVAAEDTYCGVKAPARGYWVYVYPDWYIWGKEDLAAVGMGLSSRRVRLRKTLLNLEVAYLERDRRWGEETLAITAKGLQDLEVYSGRPFPGANPYRVEEDPRLQLSDRIGLASAQSMWLAPPAYSSPWTALHEAVHIWNAPVQADWVCEGLADTISWLLMEDNHFAFDADETMAYYMDEWKPVMGTRKDGPLPTRYDRLPQGKAMYFWLMLYQLYGPDFLRQVFRASLDDYGFNVAELGKMIQQVSGRDPAPLFSGWLKAGAYRVRQPSDFGPVKFPLPEPI